jgi:NAD(P)-dependent dehydrogenase (short-subunit alcohol dehydrogenase family)
MTTKKTLTLITGANKGLGKETARQLLALGHHVLVAARDQAKADAAVAELRSGNNQVDAIVLDVNDAKSAMRAAAHINERFGHLDVLINNAGIAEDFGTSIEAVTQEAWDKTFATNVSGVLTTTQAFLPLLKKSAAGRIVNLSSILGSIGLANDPSSPIGGGTGTGAAYAASKAALNMLTVHLARALSNTSIKVNAAHPGWVQTDMGGKNAPMALVDGVKTTVALATLPSDGPTGTYVHMGQKLPW